MRKAVTVTARPGIIIVIGRQARRLDRSHCCSEVVVGYIQIAQRRALLVRHPFGLAIQVMVLTSTVTEMGWVANERQKRGRPF